VDAAIGLVPFVILRNHQTLRCRAAASKGVFHSGQHFTTGIAMVTAVSPEMLAGAAELICLASTAMFLLMTYGLSLRH
jgi:hypothetical protein